MAILKRDIAAIDVAEYFIWLCNDSGSFITNLKLQKVLYYAQGWYLALKGKPLFEDDFQAWVHGPAIPHVYGSYKAFTYNPIWKKVTKPKIILPEIESFLQEIAKVFLPLDAYALELATHREMPWVKARGGLPIDAASKAVITGGSAGVSVAAFPTFWAFREAVRSGMKQTAECARTCDNDFQETEIEL
jgi:uncharacterized phage-associated protein